MVEQEPEVKSKEDTRSKRSTSHETDHRRHFSHLLGLSIFHFKHPLYWWPQQSAETVGENSLRSALRRPLIFRPQVSIDMQFRCQGPFTLSGIHYRQMCRCQCQGRFASLISLSRNPTDAEAAQQGSETKQRAWTCQTITSPSEKRILNKLPKSLGSSLTKLLPSPHPSSFLSTTYYP